MSNFKVDDYVHEESHGMELFRVISVEGNLVSCINVNEKSRQTYVFNEDKLTNSDDTEYPGMHVSN